MSTSWLLVTKLGACVAFDHYFYHELRSVLKKTLTVLTLAKETLGTSQRNHEKCCGIKWTITEVRIVMSGGYSGKFSQRQCEIQLPRDNLGEQKVLESAFFRFSKSLKSNILATRVPPPGYFGFITNLLFWVTQRLERMHHPR